MFYVYQTKDIKYRYRPPRDLLIVKAETKKKAEEAIRDQGIVLAEYEYVAKYNTANILRRLNHFGVWLTTAL